MQEFDSIETPESVDLHRRLAGIGSRFIACVIDGLLMFLTILALWLLLLAVLLGSMNPFWASFDGLRNEAPFVVISILLALTFVLVWGYFIFWELVTNGQSPGKKAVGIRVVRADGTPVTFWETAIRNLLRIVDFLPGFYGLGGTVAFFTRRCQRLGDLAAGTVVVSEARAGYSARGGGGKPLPTASSPSPAAALRVSRLRSQEALVLDNYMSRRSELSPQVRERILAQLLAPILDRLGESVQSPGLTSLEEWTLFELRRTARDEPNPRSLPATAPEGGGAP